MLRYVVAFVLLPGCATITTGQNQSISVETRAKGVTVAGASCKLQNDKGTWFIQSPGSVTINRAYSDLAVSCSHERHGVGSATFASTTKAMAFGNVIAGGVIGAAVDMSTGSAYDYPSLLTLELDMAAPTPSKN